MAFDWGGFVNGLLTTGIGGYNSIVTTKYQGEAMLEAARFNRNYAQSVNEEYNKDLLKKVLIGVGFFITILILVVFLLNNNKNK